jgi:hypothetical protein
METFKIQPSYIVIETSAASGGVTYHRETISQCAINGGDGQEREFKTNKRVDHVALVKEADALISKSRAVLRKRCAATPLGWVCEEAQLTMVRLDMEEIAGEAEAFNQRAAGSWCARRVRIGYVPVKLEIDNLAAADEIARTIREVLAELRDKLAAHCTGAQFNSFYQTKCKNLDRLAAGMQRFAITDALACAKVARTELTNAAKDKRDPVLDLEAIESAIGMFTDIAIGDAADGDALLSMCA